MIYITVFRYEKHNIVIKYTTAGFVGDRPGI